MKINIAAFEQARILVVGDIMLDRYWHGATSRISPEAPVPVVKVGEIEDRPGGAANVALNIAGLAAYPLLQGVVGYDEAAHVLEKQLHKAQVETDLQRTEQYPTITKLRVLSRHQQLIRLDFEESLQTLNCAPLLERLQARLADVDLVLLSDYAKGTLNDAPALIRAARAAGKPVLVDPKGSDFRAYSGATLITPNLSEFEAVVGACADEAELVVKGEQLRDELELEALLITRGEHGMTLLERGHSALHLPTQAKEVYDVTGAGDTVISTLATALASGHSMPEAVTVANIAAGIVVGKLGTATVSIAELHTALHSDKVMHQGVVQEEQLQEAIQLAHVRGESVVMTNGCFDILHAGHVAYLEQAKKLGQRLIVAVNDDASVKRLKGDERPVNPLERRMAVLAGLAAVDWVVPFSEDTPERLICSLLPDILVKGGDYRPEEIAGGRCVIEHGGEVKVLGFEDGCSTTAIIDSIRGD